MSAQGLRVATSDGLWLDVHEAGGEAAGAPAALLLHGFPQSALCWRHVVPGLRALGLRTLAVDQRGYSPDARPEQATAYALDRLVADAEAVLDTAGVPAALVVGHDWGAVVGWALAAARPERVTGLVALSVPHPAAYAEALASDEDQQRRSAYLNLMSQPGRAERVLLEDDARRLRAMFAGSGMTEGEIDAYVAPLASTDALAGALAWYRAMTGPELSAVPQVSVRTTYVWSDEDVAVGPVAARNCERFVSGEYTFTALPGVSHWIPDQAPDAVIEAVRRTL